MESILKPVNDYLSKGTGSLQSSLQSNVYVNNLINLYKANEVPVLVTLGSLALTTVISAWIISAPKKVQRPIRPRRRAKPAPKIILSPDEQIAYVLKEFNQEVSPLITKFSGTVNSRMEALEGKPDVNVKSFAKDKKYKDALEYQSKYLEETILKLIISLDGIEAEDNPELKSRRKDAVKVLQGGARTVDAMSAKVAELKAKGVEY